MKIENTIKVIKEVHPDRVVMCKIGPFMHCYGRDAVIMSYLFDYSLKKIDNNYNCGFPNGALNKIMGTLEGKKISYMVVNRADNFAVENEEDLKENNQYQEIYSKAHKYVSKKNRINEIYNYLIENIGTNNIKGKISQIEEILYEE
ncbi:MAG TPA: hypothetical protein DCZ30_04885 [Clostridiales bacterium]|nr:hypothetical protein [Clostridiales bacterium]